MAKNIVIFSDGTGQRGGVSFDERRSNIYKLFRATRCGPDSLVNPMEQLTYYDPGLGTAPEGSGFLGSTYRHIRNILSQATGLGITANIIDCYAEVIRMWEPGDRIFLFGFSRGAYTARCVASVVSFCGVPTTMKDKSPLKRDDKTVRSIERDAVTNVYQHVGSPKDTRYLDQRRALAKRFREQHSASKDDGPNVYPYFVGVFDTVASLASYPALLIVLFGAAAILGALSFGLAQLTLTFMTWLALLGGASLVVAFLWYVENHLKYAFNLPGYSFWETLHLTALKMRFYDNLLNINVGYARHALAIDEYRKSFDRVKWGNRKDEWPHRKGTIWFKQLWFAGNHSDIGGSYPENESRLSDIVLQWMVEEAQKVPDGLKTDNTVLRLFPSSKGMQHDETKTGLFKFAGKIDRELIDTATLHPSVYERFKEAAVLQLDEMKPYRPKGLTRHGKLAEYYPNEKLQPDASSIA